MNIVVIGLNHKTAPVELRERLAFSKTKLAQAYSYLCNCSSIHESLILSTCNRVEIYSVVDKVEEGIASLKKFLSSYHSENLEEFEYNLYTYIETESVSHLFNVASGLDSMVLGETQILGQLKQAYFNARENSAIGEIFEILLQRAFCTAKEVRNSTYIARGAVSVSSVAVKLAEEILGSLSQRKVMVIGAGKMSELAVKYLLSKGSSSILVSNRTYKKAEELAQRFGGQAIRFNQLLDSIVISDIVISSTCAPHFVLKKEDIVTLVQQKKNKPLFFIDLAVPRDIDPEIAKVKGAYLYNIDDLQKIAQKNVQLRQKEVQSCRQIIQSKVNLFMNWFDYGQKEQVTKMSSGPAHVEKSLLQTKG